MSGSGSDLPGVVPFANKHPQSLTSHERDDAICAPRDRVAQGLCPSST